MSQHELSLPHFVTCLADSGIVTMQISFRFQAFSWAQSSGVENEPRTALSTGVSKTGQLGGFKLKLGVNIFFARAGSPPSTVKGKTSTHPTLQIAKLVPTNNTSLSVIFMTITVP